MLPAGKRLGSTSIVFFDSPVYVIYFETLVGICADWGLSATRRKGMFGLGTQELLLILLLVMIIFGAGKLPQVGSSLGKGLRNFKKGMHEADEEIEEAKVEKIDEKNDKEQ